VVIEYISGVIMGKTITFYTDNETYENLLALLVDEAQRRMSDVSRSNYLTGLINRTFHETHNGHEPDPCKEEE
jgi:hypothetical protein